MISLIPWIYLPEPLQEGQIKELSEGQRHHLVSVLRLRPGDPLIVSNGQGKAWNARLAVTSSRRGAVSLGGELCIATEPSLRVYLAQALLKSTKMDLVIQKAVEIGVTGIIPVVSARSVPRWPQGEDNKMKRWKIIMESAAAQSHRIYLPRLFAPVPLQDLTELLAPETACLACWEEEKETSFHDVLQRRPSGNEVAVAIGPEGGFTEEEIIFLRSRGWRTVSMGPRILRAETASLVALSVILFEHGDLG